MFKKKDVILTITNDFIKLTEERNMLIEESITKKAS
jgi:hypothetical protein